MAAQYDSRTKEYIEHLIKQEMSVMTKAPDKYPQASTFRFTESFIGTQLERLIEENNGCPLPEGSFRRPFEGQRYQVKEPSEKQSIEGWKGAIQHACIQYELQKKR